MAKLSHVNELAKDQRLRIAVSERLQTMGFDSLKSNRAANLIVNALETDDAHPGSRALESVLQYEGIAPSQLNLVDLLRKVAA